MPCRDYGWEERENAKNRLDMLARIACKALKAYENQGFSAGMILDPKEHNWWLAHKKADENRIRMEEEEARRVREIRENALAKLTPEERKALNFGF